MNRLPITAIVAPYVNDILVYKSRGYPWLYIRDMLVTAKVLSEEVKLLSFRRACITNLYVKHVEQKPIPAPATPTPTRPVPAQQEAGRREGYGIPVRSREESGSTNSMKDELAKKGIVFK